MSEQGWLTNDPEVAAALRAADSAYVMAKAATANMCLADKVVALRLAREARARAYAATYQPSNLNDMRDKLREEIANTGDT